MEKIEFLRLYRLRNDEHYQFITDIKVLINKATAEELGIADINTSFNTAFNAEDTAMKVELGSSQSKAIRDLDAERDKTWNALSLRIDAAFICPVVAEAKAGEALKRVFNLYGDKRKAPYNEESAALTKLVADLLSPANKPHCETLGIIAWVEALKTQNEAFQAVLNNRNEELAGRTSGNTWAFREDVDKYYQKIVDRINSTIELNLAKPGVEKFVKEVNEKIAYYKNVIAIRKGRKLSEKKASLPS
jgi:hypothetical protein